MLELLDPKWVWVRGSKRESLPVFVFWVPLIVWFSGTEHPELYGKETVPTWCFWKLAVSYSAVFHSKYCYPACLMTMHVLQWFLQIFVCSRLVKLWFQNEIYELCRVCSLYFRGSSRMLLTQCYVALLQELTSDSFLS